MGDVADVKLKVAVFGSFYRGFYLLNELLYGRISKHVTVVGVATDDPDASYISADTRVWQYPHSPYEKSMVAKLASRAGLDVHLGRVKDNAFYELIEKKWQPDICIIGTFGQRIDRRLIELPPLGFYNLHPCIDDKWPSQYVGGNPFDALMKDRKNYTKIAFHAVDEGFDTGELIAMSDRIAFPEETSVTDMHKISSFAAAQLAGNELEKIILTHRRANV